MGRGLATNLVGRVATRRSDEPEYQQVPWWPLRYRNASGEAIAEIVAAWTEDHSTKVALVAPDGETGEAWLTLVRVLPARVE